MPSSNGLFAAATPAALEYGLSIRARAEPNNMDCPSEQCKSHTIWIVLTRAEEDKFIAKPLR